MCRGAPRKNRFNLDSTDGEGMHTEPFTVEIPDIGPEISRDVRCGRRDGGRDLLVDLFRLRCRYDRLRHRCGLCLWPNRRNLLHIRSIGVLCSKFPERLFPCRDLLFIAYRRHSLCS